MDKSTHTADTPCATGDDCAQGDRAAHIHRAEAPTSLLRSAASGSALGSETAPADATVRLAAHIMADRMRADLRTVESEIADLEVKLAWAERRFLIHQLRADGKTWREIGAQIGCSHEQARKIGMRECQGQA